MHADAGGVAFRPLADGAGVDFINVPAAGDDAGLRFCLGEELVYAGEFLRTALVLRGEEVKAGQAAAFQDAAGRVIRKQYIGYPVEGEEVPRAPFGGLRQPESVLLNKACAAFPAELRGIVGDLLVSVGALRLGIAIVPLAADAQPFSIL